MVALGLVSTVLSGVLRQALRAFLDQRVAWWWVEEVAPRPTVAR